MTRVSGVDRSAHWADRAACSRANGDVDPDWWWPPPGQAGAAAQLAVHVCWAHCPVRRQCDADGPPLHPCIQGGRRYVTVSGVGYQTAVAKSPVPGSSVGCPYCREAS